MDFVRQAAQARLVIARTRAGSRSATRVCELVDGRLGSSLGMSMSNFEGSELTSHTDFPSLLTFNYLPRRSSRTFAIC